MVTVRRFGIRWLLAALAMAGLAGSALAASAQWDAAGGPLARRTGPPRWHHPAMPMRGHRLGEPTLDRPLLLAFRHLELTDAQWQRVQAILEVQHLRQGAGDTAPQRRAQIAALFDPGDPQHSQALQAARERAVARIDQAAQTQQSLYDVLTPAQKRRLQQLVAQRRERVHERRQRHDGHGEPGASGQSGQSGQGAAAAPSDH